MLIEADEAYVVNVFKMLELAVVSHGVRAKAVVLQVAQNFLSHMLKHAPV
jgi:hypothetical protein